MPEKIVKSKQSISGPISSVYKPSLSMLTDLYEITMAYGYWKSGAAAYDTVFYMSFRKNPFEGGFAISCGLAHLIDFIGNFRFDQSDVEYLSSLKGDLDWPLFENDFLDYLRELRFTCDISAVPDGTCVFAHEPLVRVVGPIIQCQLIESLLLNIMNFQTLIATKAARVSIAAGDRPVVEFGLRRAQGIDGALAASYAAYIGGCTATSNVLAGKLYGIPVKGTHAHSWVMSFDSELQAFEAYADALPHNSIFLVDTYDTISGVSHAIQVGQRLKQNGHKFSGIRLDSGDLAYLSIQARRMLDQAGFKDALILASNDLDEYVIKSLNDQDARIDVWGVGTNLITAYDQPALGGVYKLSALRKPNQEWESKIKLSEQAVKISVPGTPQVRRFTQTTREGKHFVGDMVFDQNSLPMGANVIIDPTDFTRRRRFGRELESEDLLVPVFVAGELCYNVPSLADTKARVAEQIALLHPTNKRLMNPHQYPVGLEQGLHALRTALILELRNLNQTVAD